ncbi:MAG: phage minor capsid protein [Anaerorhabdus sp.]|uniref:phage minor capsid protein n=1 Tax=Anaerorhabdus sp. TaxID=1872524 RepID=UPI003A8391D2
MSLNPFYLAHVADSLDNLWSDFEEDILKDLAKRIKHSDGSLSSTAKWRYTKLRELGASEKYIQSQIAKYLKRTDKEINRIFEDAIISSLANDDEIFRQAYEQGIIAKSGYDIHDYSNLINKGVFDTYHEIRNFTKSFYASASNTFANALDMAYLQVSSGVMSETEACKYAIENLAKNGIVTTTSKSGRLEHADVIVSRAVRTGVNITSGKVMWGILDDLDCDLVETTSHMGARPTHALWQGQVFSRSGKSKRYPDFRKSTGYGTGEGICGWNCRHSFYPYFEGLSTVSARRYSMQENERIYNLTQKQRYNERMIRKWKREQVVLDAGGLDSSLATRKVKGWKKINDDLIKSNSDVLKHDYFRESIIKTNSIKNKGNVLLSIKNEFIKNSTPGLGKITFDNNFDFAKNNHEIEISEWLFSVFGGNIHHKVESKIVGVKTPDIDWNNEPWEIKRPTTLNAVDDRLRKAIKQIDGTYGGVILDLHVEDEFEKIKEKVESRLRFHNALNLTVILKKDSLVLDIVKMKKHP